MPTSILPQGQNGQELYNAISFFFSRFHIGNLLRRCNAQKEKGIPVIQIFKYKLCNVFSDRSMYMQQKTGSFKESFSKNSSRIRYEFNGKQLSIKKIFGICKKRRGRSKYLLSVDVMVGKDQKVPARIVCVRNRNNKKDWIAFICTDTSLSPEEIIRIYGKRWQIEVFFKTCKSYLNLIGECHSPSYYALTAHVAIVFARYMMIALEQRKNQDERTLGELFFYFVDELADITFAESYQILVRAMFECIYAIFKVTEEQVNEFIDLFIRKLPEYIQKSLVRGCAAA